jgi:hypothetical protein
VILNTRPKSSIGQRVRVITGSCAGAVGVIADVEVSGSQTWFRVSFEPPVYIAAVGRVASVWRVADGLEEVS